MPRDGERKPLLLNGSGGAAGSRVGNIGFGVGQSDPHAAVVRCFRREAIRRRSSWSGAVGRSKAFRSPLSRRPGYLSCLPKKGNPKKGTPEAARFLRWMPTRRVLAAPLTGLVLARLRCSARPTGSTPCPSYLLRIKSSLRVCIETTFFKPQHT